MARGTHPDGAPEAIVIGSGFGGAVAACRLAQHGYRVLILERGRRYGADDFPALPTDAGLLPDLKRWSWPLDHGLWDIVDLEEVVSVQAAGYGGGSLIYANVHLRPPVTVFDDRWPIEYRARRALEPYFDLAASMLEAQPATLHPDFGTFKKAHELQQIAGKLGRKEHFFYPPLAVTFEERTNAHGVPQGACTACGRCCTGCPSKAKNTLDFNYLALAERHGASVVTECEVTKIVELDDGRFRVDCIDHLEGDVASHEAKFVFVCAGSVHSTRLLARADLKRPDVKSRVGVGYFPGGDALGMIYDTREPQAPERGPTITTTLVHGEQPGQFFLIQDGGYANELARLLGMVRAPAWVGRNRLSTATQSKDALPAPSSNDFRLPSLPDDVLRALESGEFGAKMASTQLRDAFPKLLRELQHPLLLPAVVDRTVLATIRARYARWQLTRRLSPDRWPLASAIALERWFIRHWFGTNEALGEQALKAVLTQGGLSVAEVARQMFGYDARGAAFRTMLLAMGRDAAPGVLQYDADTDTQTADLDLFHLAFGYTSEERLMTDIAHELGGELRSNPAWAFLGKPITVHNQGGCRMSTKPEHGVTTPEGAVHGYDTLFVLDGAVLCTSVGVNPSATITAIAERNVEHFLAHHAPERPNAAGRSEYLRQVEWSRAFRERASRWKGARIEPPELPPVALRAQPLGLRFDEGMQGYYQPSSEQPQHDSDFREQERRGRPAHPVRVDLRLSAENLQVFFEDDEHTLRATGRIALVMPGETQPQSFMITLGRVELMVPRYKPHGVPKEQNARLVAQEFALRGQTSFEQLTATELAQLGTSDFTGRRHRSLAGTPRPGEARFLRYWLGFAAGNEHYLLYGYKRVKDDPGFDAWRDTASLFIGLYRSSDKPNLVAIPPPSSIVGAGVIHVDMNEFMFKQLPSMIVAQGVDPLRPLPPQPTLAKDPFAPLPDLPSRDRPGSVDPARAAWAVAKFGAFFFGSLQRVYAPNLGKLVETFFGMSQGSRPQ